MDGGGEVGWYVLGPNQEHVGPYALSELQECIYHATTVDARFAPVDNHLFACGAATPAVLPDGRHFILDSGCASSPHPPVAPNAPTTLWRPLGFGGPGRPPRSSPQGRAWEGPERDRVRADRVAGAVEHPGDQRQQPDRALLLQHRPGALPLPHAPALASQFWLWMVTWHLGLFIVLTFGQIGFKGRTEDYFEK